MHEFLEKLKPTYCDDCDIKYSICNTTIEYCKKDMINAYQQGRTDGINEFAEYIKKQFRIGVNTIDDVIKRFKEQSNDRVFTKRSTFRLE